MLQWVRNKRKNIHRFLYFAFALVSVLLCSALLWTRNTPKKQRKGKKVKKLKQNVLNSYTNINISLWITRIHRKVGFFEVSNCTEIQLYRFFIHVYVVMLSPHPIVFLIFFPHFPVLYMHATLLLLGAGAASAAADDDFFSFLSFSPFIWRFFSTHSVSIFFFSSSFFFSFFFSFSLLRSLEILCSCSATIFYVLIKFWRFKGGVITKVTQHIFYMPQNSTHRFFEHT